MKFILIISYLLLFSVLSYSQEYVHNSFDGHPEDSLLVNYPEVLGQVQDLLEVYYIGTDQDTMLSMEEYYTAIDIIMAEVSSDPEKQIPVAEYLLSLFEGQGLEPVQGYISDYYYEEQCELDIVELVLERMEGYKSMKPGTMAPDFEISDRHNNTYRPGSMDKSFILVMFWASTCDHCRRMLPKLHDWYLKENTLDMEFITISIDTTYYQYEAFLGLHQFEWICAFDTLGWHGKVPSVYNVYATPSLFLLDSNLRILSRPFTYREFIRALKKL